MKVVVVLGSQGGTQMCLGRDLGGDDPRLPGDLPRHEGSAGSWREAFGSVGIKPTVKVTAFNLNAQEAR